MKKHPNKKGRLPEHQAGDLLIIHFSQEHRQKYPAYSSRFHGRTAQFIRAARNSFYTVLVLAGNVELCIEKDFLIPAVPELSLVKV